MHMLCLRDMGLMLGEYWDLTALAADCAAVQQNDRITIAGFGGSAKVVRSDAHALPARYGADVGRVLGPHRTRRGLRRRAAERPDHHRRLRRIGEGGPI